MKTEETWRDFLKWEYYWNNILYLNRFLSFISIIFSRCPKQAYPGWNQGVGGVHKRFNWNGGNRVGGKIDVQVKQIKNDFYLSTHFQCGRRSWWRWRWYSTFHFLANRTLFKIWVCHSCRYLLRYTLSN
jgi:hypothetical protein